MLLRLEPLIAPGLFLLALLLAAARPRRLELRLLRATRLAAWPLLGLLFVLPILAAWGLQPTGNVSATAALLGRIPHLDAHAHLEGALRLLADGAFTDASARRPLNACWLATRLGLAGGRLAAALVLQAMLLGVAVAAGARVAAARAGLPGALAFVAVVYGLTRDYAATINTEPLGVTLAVLGFALIVDSARAPSLGRMLAGLWLVDLGLHARPGPQFVAPALALWIVVTLRGRRLRAAALALAVLAANAGLTATLNARYGPRSSSFFSYPAYTLYGLASGGDYRRALDDHGPALAALPDERARARFLYAQAAERIRARPLTLLATLADNALDAITKPAGNLTRITDPAMLLVDPKEQVRPPRWTAVTSRVLGIPLLLLAAALGARRIATALRRERTAWLAIGAATLASAAVVFGDAGFRGLAVVYPALALFLSGGLGRRHVAAGLRATVPVAIGALVALGALIGPALVARSWPRPESARLAAATGDDLVVRLDGAVPRVVVWNQPPDDLAPLAVSRKQFQNGIAVGEARNLAELEALRPPLVLLSAYDHRSRTLRLVSADAALARERDRFLVLHGDPAGDVFEVASWAPLPE